MNVALRRRLAANVGGQPPLATTKATATWARVDPRRLLFDLEAGDSEARVGAQAEGARARFSGGPGATGPVGIAGTRR